MNFLRIFFIFLGVFINSALKAQPYALQVFKKVEQHTLLHIPWIDEEWPQESFYDYLTRCLNYQKIPQEFKKRRLAFKLIYGLQEQQPTKICNVLNDTTTWQDLSLFSGARAGQASLVEKIHRTNTQVGKALFACMLANPLSEIAELKKRQAIIREMTENQELYDQLSLHLDQIACVESLMLSFWAHDPLEQSAQRHYLNIPGATKLNEMLNRNDAVLEATTLWDNKLRVIHATTSAMAAVILPAYAVSKMVGYKPSKRFEHFAYDLFRGGTLIALLKYGFSFVKHTGDLRDAASRGAMLGDGILYSFSIKGNCEWVRDNMYLDMCLQEKLIDVASYIKTTECCARLINESPKLASLLATMPDLNKALHQLPQEFEELAQFFELIRSSTFTGQASVISRKGRVLVAYKLMHLIKKHLQPLIGFIAEVDAYMSAATLYKEFGHQKARYCFVDFIARDKPLIELHNFWNPFVDNAKVVTNSLTLGGHQRSNIILTGPNAGGKSTVLKATALSLILAQAFGLAPAQSMMLTPMSTIATYLNITDDIESGNSLFKAEVLRAQALIEKVQNLTQNQFSFIAIDEMFSGTSPEEGRAAAYSVAKHLGQFSNNICMIATHYPLLTKLAQDTPFFANYKVSVKLDADGTITYPFKLEPGVSDQHVAIDILQAEGFNSTILSDARNLLNLNNRN